MNPPFPSMTAPNQPLEEKTFYNILMQIETDQMTVEQQKQLVDAMNPAIHRQLVQKYSSMDASVVVVFKKQLELVDAVLRRIVNSDGTATPYAEDYTINLKDALNLSLRVTQVMVRDLPKVYGVARIQKQEEALQRVMRENMTEEQQEKLLIALEEIEQEVTAG